MIMVSPLLVYGRENMVLNKAYRTEVWTAEPYDVILDTASMTEYVTIGPNYGFYCVLI
jgi:hypothetical protein